MNYLNLTPIGLKRALIVKMDEIGVGLYSAVEEIDC